MADRSRSRTHDPQVENWRARFGQADAPAEVFQARVCWRCGGLGFVRAPCQVCGRWRTNRWEGGVLLGTVVVQMAGSVWGDEAPPTRPKPRTPRRKDR